MNHSCQAWDCTGDNQCVNAKGQKKVKIKKAKKVELTLDGHTLNFLEAIAELSSRDLDTVVNVLLAAFIIQSKKKSK